METRVLSSDFALHGRPHMPQETDIKRRSLSASTGDIQGTRVWKLTAVPWRPIPAESRTVRLKNTRMIRTCAFRGPKDD